MNTKNLKKQLSERLKTVEDAYKETGRPKIDFSFYPEDLRVNREAEYNVIVLIEAARKIEIENGSDEKLDWTDYSQWKWIPWFRISASGFAFAFTDFDYSRAFAGSGSRLRVLSKITCEYLGETFLDIWEKVQLF
ncbi:hypothetical protein [Dysgonomonas macrotermitis]|uniref:Uncharacterized protein n=1 Tax=Dysgonomonas macrotermitis TaxID=1346286 RepID=A0A1M5J0A4_9BACT|nr:hypothetical protein [Dysgonomonas macrotermitis]SHG33650.1 hypothetical protein SAMN05444362_12166 [Dysgonomonas macrotermitis]